MDQAIVIVVAETKSEGKINCHFLVAKPLNMCNILCILLCLLGNCTVVALYISGPRNTARNIFLLYETFHN